MSYIGQSPGQGQAERFIFTATGGETSVTLDDAGRGIAYTVGQVDVYLNGVKLVNGTDFTATSGSSITGLSALVASDIVEIVALDAFSPADTVSASNGGTFYGTLDTQLVEPRTDDTYDLGTSSKRFQDAYLSGGIYLGGTGAANYLDDYETGTWTPAFFAASGSATYTTQIGNYVKVGRQVTVTFFITVNVSSSLVAPNISGLPFAGGDTNYAAASFSSYESGAFGAFNTLLGLVANTVTTIQLRGTTSATSAPVTISQPITNGTVLAGSITYFTNA